MVNRDSSRKIWVLQGDSKALFEQIYPIVIKYPADWITVTDQVNRPTWITNFILPSKTRSLLGREFKHAIFDATQGFNLDAFAILTGTLIKGSLLILLLPENLNNWKDQDSLRWNENPSPIAPPNFINHLFEIFKQMNIQVNKGREINQIDDWVSQLPKKTKTDIDIHEQQSILKQLQKSSKSIIALIAKRGRGKSALAGLFTHNHDCVVTAPNRDSLNSFFKFSKMRVNFYAPDDLIASHRSNLPEYLIIDEAAMIPLPLLEALLDLPCRILLITTVDGYEGTGQGFLLKLLKDKEVDYFYLNTPIRWYDNDQLELFTDQLLLNNEINNQSSDVVIEDSLTEKSIEYSLIANDAVDRLKLAYMLLKTAHYRTTPIDLRRFLDAENTFVWQATHGEQIVGSLIAINEGGLPDDIVDQVWQGTRRPKGNLVAQSLVAHAGEKKAAQLHSIRINRIAVLEHYRRRKIASHLIEQLASYALQQGKDFLSTSFAYSEANEHFWSRCGFILVHVASHKEGSSGNYSVMAIKAITQQGKDLQIKLHRELKLNWFWLKRIIELKLDIDKETETEQRLTEQDLALLAGFAKYHRPFEATYASLCRLNQAVRCGAVANTDHELIYPILDAIVEKQTAMSNLIEKYQLSGRKEVIFRLRQEVMQLLIAFS